MSIRHDSGYKLLFSHKELVRDLLIEFVPPANAGALNLDSLERVSASFLSDSGIARHGDLVWKLHLADDEWLYIYLMLEFQSESDRWMALRMQVYVGLLYQDLVRRKELAPKDTLPPVLPIVLYNGPTPWRAATDLTDLLAPVPPNLIRLQPVQRYWLIEVGAYDPEILDTKANLVAALFQLQQSRADEQEKVDRIFVRLSAWLADPMYSDLRRSFALAISQLLRVKVKDPTIPDITDLMEIRTMFPERRLEWWEEWMQEGKKKGLAEGLIEGRLKGEASLLHRQLRRRFGQLPGWVEVKLAAATEEDLLRWGDGVVDTKTLEQVFRG